MLFFPFSPLTLYIQHTSVFSSADLQMPVVYNERRYEMGSAFDPCLLE